MAHGANIFGPEKGKSKPRSPYPPAVKTSASKMIYDQAMGRHMPPSKPKGSTKSVVVKKSGKPGPKPPKPSQKANPGSAVALLIKGSPGDPAKKITKKRKPK